MTELNTTTTTVTEQPIVTTETAPVNVTEATTVTEAPKTEEPKDEKKERVAKQFAELSKRERRLVEQERRLKEQSTKVAQYEKNLQKAKENPIDFIKDLTGENFDSILNKYIGLVGTDDKKPEDIKLQRLEERIVAYEKAEQERQETLKQQSSQQMWQQHLNVVSNYVEQNKDQYEVILSHPQRAVQIYQDILSQAIRDAGRELAEDEVVACINRTEEWMTEEYKPLIEKLTKTKKFSPTVTVKTEPEKVITETLKPRTLTNNLSTATPTLQTDKKLSREERDRLKLEEIRRKYDSK